MDKKRIDNKYFDVHNMTGNGGLCTRKGEDFEALIEEINSICESARANGWNNDDKYVIMENHVIREWDENGMFVYEKHTITAYAKYDNGFVSMI